MTRKWQANPAIYPNGYSKAVLSLRSVVIPAGRRGQMGNVQVVMLNALCAFDWCWGYQESQAKKLEVDRLLNVLNGHFKHLGNVPSEGGKESR